MFNLEQYLTGETRDLPPAIPRPPVPMGRVEYELFVYKTLRHVKPQTPVIYQPYFAQVV
jgi:hypothetical protein